MKNTFGIYVIQKALILAEGMMKEDLAIKIKEYVPFLTNKNVKTRWNQILDRCMQNQVATTSIPLMNIADEELRELAEEDNQI